MPADDLVSVLSNVAVDARPATREKIANSPETRAFLEVGLMLLRDDLLDHRGPDLLADHDAGTRLFAGLSQARLVERAEREGLQDERPLVLTVGMFRDRWRYKSRYTEDLIAYLLRPARLEQVMQETRVIAHALARDKTFPELIKAMSHAVLESTLDDPLWSLQTIMWVALPKHPGVQSFLKVRYEKWIAHWASVYEEVTVHYGVRLRPGYTWWDIAELINAVADGARLRARAMGSMATLSSGDDVLVGAIQALVGGLLEPAESEPPAAVE